MAQIYRYELTVPEDALDVNGHVNNLEYLRCMQDAAILHSDSQGCTRITTAAGEIWVVRIHRFEYLRPAFAGEQIIVLTWVSNFRRVQSLRKYRIIRVQDNAVLVEGETDGVFVDAKTGRLRSIPKNIIAAFEILPKEKKREFLNTGNLSSGKPFNDNHHVLLVESRRKESAAPKSTFGSKSRRILMRHPVAEGPFIPDKIGGFCVVGNFP
jgi:acyl-CoA thioester hydrolase